MKKRRERGITLIALIITIIVMLILVGVTINVALNGGLITVTQEAKFKTKVRQIQEALQVKKVTLAATNGGKISETISITLNDLDMEQKLKDDFETKLAIEKSEEDLVLCYTDKVSSQEAIWLEGLGIYGEVTFRSYVTRAALATGKIGDYTNLEDLGQQIKEKYSNSIIFYRSTLGAIVTEDEADGTSNVIKILAGYEKIGKVIEESGLTDDEIVPDTTDPDTVSDENMKQIISIANEYGVPIQGSTIENIKNRISIARDTFGDMSLIAVNESEQLLVDLCGNIKEYDGDSVIMSEEDADELFIFKDSSDGWMISAYIGMQENVNIPAFIYNSNGEITKEVIGIKQESFMYENPTLVPMIEAFGMSEAEYNNLTVAELFDLSIGGEYTGENGNSKEASDKFEMLKEAFRTEFDVRYKYS